MSYRDRSVQVFNPALKSRKGGADTQGCSPTRVRWHIAGMLAVIAALTFLDRVNLSIAGKYIQDEFAFNTHTMGWILSAFILGYALFQVPSGWLGDRLGPDKVLTGAILWWSLFTAATGIAPRLPIARHFGLVGSFVFVRFLIGVGEAATFPNANKIIALWLGKDKRAIGNSLPFAGMGVGGAMTPVLIAAIMQRWGWRYSFYLCALLGIIVAVVWQHYATTHPETNPRVNAAELQIIQLSRGTVGASFAIQEQQRNLPNWEKSLRSVSFWGLLFSFAATAYPVYIYYTWFFIYLVRVRGLTVMQGGLWGMSPFIAIALLAPLGGWISDRAVLRFGTRRGRQYAVWLGHGASATLLLTGSHIANNTLAVLLLAGAAGFNLFSTSTLWAVCIDLSPNFSGTLSGLMNTAASVGGWLSPIGTAYIAARFGWTRALDFAALITLLGGAAWLLVKADKNLEEAAC